MSQFRLQTDSVAFTVVQVPCSTGSSLCGHHLSFHSHPIIYSKTEIPSTLSLQLYLRIPCQVRSQVKALLEGINQKIIK